MGFKSRSVIAAVLLGAASGMACFGGMGCSTPAKKSRTLNRGMAERHDPSRITGIQPLNLPLSTRPRQPGWLWSKKAPGFLTDLALASKTRQIAVVSVPDLEDENPAEEGPAALSLWSASGERLWSVALAAVARSISISDDGSLIAVATADNRWTALDASGKTLWTANGACRPRILSRIKRVLCVHEDGASGTAFDWLDFNGTQIASTPVQDEVLAVKIAPDESHFAMALTKGKVLLIKSADGNIEKIWQKRVEGDAFDVAVTRGEKPTVAVLSWRNRSDQRISSFDFRGKLRVDRPIPKAGSQIEIGEDGNIYVFGNTPKGQTASLYDGETLTLKWEQGTRRMADFSSPLSLDPNGAVIGIEELAESKRQSHLVGLDATGKSQWDVPLITADGAYIYASGTDNSGELFIAVATDDAVLSAYGVAPAPSK